MALTLGRIYLGAKAQQLVQRRIGPPDMDARWERFSRESAEAIFDAAVDLRGLILKACQFLGSRPDMLPPAFVEVLSTLQDRVPPRSFETIRALAERELGAPLESVFASFSRRAVAAASLAQVHEATLPNGARVAVKVQYPEIRQLVHSDLADLRRILGAIGWLERDLDLDFVIDEFANTIPQELDFVREGHNSERIASMLGVPDGRPDLFVPKVHWDLSSSRLLVCEFVDGIKITDAPALRRAGVDTTQVMQSLIEIYCEQILVHGFFHADPHPGNLFVLPGDSAGGGPARVAMIDFGLAKELPSGFREGCVAFASALLTGKPDGMARALEDMGFETRDGGRPALERIAALLLDAAAAVRHQSYADRESLRGYGREISRLVRENPIVRMPSHIVLLGRTVALLSGIGKALDVHIDMLKIILPYVMGTAPSRKPRA